VETSPYAFIVGRKKKEKKVD